MRSRLGVSSAIRSIGASAPPSGRRRTEGSRLSRLASRAAVTATDSSALDGGSVQLPFGLCAIGVGGSPFPGDREVVDSHREVVDLTLGQALEVEDLLVGE